MLATQQVYKAGNEWMMEEHWKITLELLFHIGWNT